jgi:two-component system NtrC family sensor kinase
VLKVISRSTFDLKSVLNTLLEAAARLCEADNGTIALPKEKDVYQHVASYRQSAALDAELSRTALKVGKGSLIGRTALNRATVHILDAHKDPDYELRTALKLGDYRSPCCAKEIWSEFLAWRAKPFVPSPKSRLN